MTLVDPHTHRPVLLDECVQTAPLLGYISVKPFVGDEWFAVYTPTGETFKFEAVVGALLGSRLKSRALLYELDWACEQIGNDTLMLDEDVDETRLLDARRAATEKWGGLWVECVELACRVKYPALVVREGWRILFGEG